MIGRARQGVLAWLSVVAVNASVSCADSHDAPTTRGQGGSARGGGAGNDIQAGAAAAADAGGVAHAGEPAGGKSNSSAGSNGVGGNPSAGNHASFGGDGQAGAASAGAPDDYPFSGCVLTGSDPALIAGEGGEGGAAGADQGSTVPAVLNGSCATWGALGCSGDFRQSLVCDKGVWAKLSECVAAQSCDPRSGVCAAVAPICADHAVGFTSCASDELQRCGADRVSLEHAPCCGTCANGSCQAARCGDGKVEANEACDDGNTLAGDGCEPDCKTSQVLELSGGGSHTCARLRGGAVRCWGDNEFGQLGLGLNADFSGKEPYQLGPLALAAPAVALASGANHSCALLRGGAVRCWGQNNHGQLGLGHSQNIGDDEVPGVNAEVALGAKALALAAGGDETCVVMQGGSVRCWGLNTYGQLGLGHTKNIGDDELPTSALAQLSLAGTAVSVAVASEHACALFDSGLIRCWGHNDVGQLGLGNTFDVGDDELPSSVDAIDFRKLAEPSLFSLTAGGQRACVGINQGGMDGWMYCWGYNGDGGLGVGLVENRPSQKAGGWGLFYWGYPTEQIVVGGGHQCVRLHNHDLHCFGLNAKGQLGSSNLDPLGDNENCTIFPPVQFPRSDADSFAYATTVTTGEQHTCAVLDTGEVRCWGRNDKGQLGLGFVSSPPADYVGGDVQQTPDQLTPTRVLPPMP